MELEIGCPICKKVNTYGVSGHPCALQCQEPDCRAVFEYAGHCHLFLDIYEQAVRLWKDGYHTASFIISFVSLELYVEWFLAHKMLRDGWNRREIRSMLRRNHSIAVRMGSLFRRVYGRSLDDLLARASGMGGSVGKLLHRFRETRNRAIHEGYQVSEAECREALDLTRSIYETLVRAAAREGVLSRPRSARGRKVVPTAGSSERGRTRSSSPIPFPTSPNTSHRYP